MGFMDRFIADRQVILDRWFLDAIALYPSVTVKFLKTQKDSFDNPVGKVTFDGLDKLLEGLIRRIDSEEFRSYIDPIVRIRAVQSYKPSEAVSFVFALKGIVRRSLHVDEFCNDADLFLFEESVDALGMVAFDVYMSCREQVYDLKANEARNQFFSSLNRAGLVTEA